MKILDYFKTLLRKPKDIRYDITSLDNISIPNFWKDRIEQIIKRETGEDVNVDITIIFK